jgi:hypothetical protein
MTCRLAQNFYREEKFRVTISAERLEIRKLPFPSRRNKLAGIIAHEPQHPPHLTLHSKSIAGTGNQKGISERQFY